MIKLFRNPQKCQRIPKNPQISIQIFKKILKFAKESWRILKFRIEIDLEIDKTIQKSSEIPKNPQRILKFRNLFHKSTTKSINCLPISSSDHQIEQIFKKKSSKLPKNLEESSNFEIFFINRISKMIWNATGHLRTCQRKGSGSLTFRYWNEFLSIGNDLFLIITVEGAEPSREFHSTKWLTAPWYGIRGIRGIIQIIKKIIWRPGYKSYNQPPPIRRYKHLV